jgi:hypothetical protein
MTPSPIRLISTQAITRSETPPQAVDPHQGARLTMNRTFSEHSLCVSFVSISIGPQKIGRCDGPAQALDLRPQLAGFILQVSSGHAFRGSLIHEPRVARPSPLRT